MFNELIEVLAGIREKRKIHESILKANEALTCRALIDPLLTVLGWDPSNPALVIPEYKIESRSADFALIDQVSGNPVAVIEAKKLGTPLESKEIAQMITYASMAGIPYAGLTDGDHWQLYEVFRQAPISERCVLDVSITVHPEHQSVLKLLMLWRPNLASRKPVKANVVFLPEEGFGKNPDEIDPGPREDCKQSGEHKCWVPIADSGVSDGDSPPNSLRFPSGNGMKIRVWADILPTICEQLAARGLLREIPFPKNPYRDSGGKLRLRKRYILNSKPIHRSGRDFFSPRRISVDEKEIYVECHHSATNTISEAIFLLKEHEVNPSQVLIHRPERSSVPT